MKVILSFLIFLAFGAQISEGKNVSLGKKWALEISETVSEAETQNLQYNFEGPDQEGQIDFRFGSLDVKIQAFLLESSPTISKRPHGFDHCHSGISPPLNS